MHLSNSLSFLISFRLLILPSSFPTYIVNTLSSYLIVIVLTLFHFLNSSFNNNISLWLWNACSIVLDSIPLSVDYFFILCIALVIVVVVIHSEFSSVDVTGDNSSGDIYTLLSLCISICTILFFSNSSIN